MSTHAGDSRQEFWPPTPRVEAIATDAAHGARCKVQRSSAAAHTARSESRDLKVATLVASAGVTALYAKQVARKR